MGRKLVFFEGLYLSVTYVAGMIIASFDMFIWQIVGVLLTLLSVILFVLLLKKQHKHYTQNSKTKSINNIFIVVILLLMLSYIVYFWTVIDTELTFMGVLPILSMGAILFGLLVQRKQLRD